MKILLGGVPFGKGNIGDEAILNCVIGIFRRNFPDADLTVATAAGELTRQKYQVNTLPPFGFDSNLTMRDFRRAARGFDMFVWAGGCGLSDYPHIGASLLENAQKLGLKTVIWQVGMNRELNPDHFQLHGRKQKIADLLGITRYWEKILEKRMRERLQVCVSRCDLVILRDQPSLIELHTSGEFPAALYGADSVVLQKSSERTVLTTDAAGRRSVGICIAEKLNKRKFQQALDFLQMLQQKLNVRLVFIPMTGSDRQLMLALYEKLPDADNKLLLDCTEPDEIQQAISVCSLLISGRLQLTIMALNSLVPGIGIANSSKIANCLSMFGLPVFNNQSDINFNDLMSECERWICDPDFPERAKSVRERMLSRLKQSESYLKDLA